MKKKIINRHFALSSNNEWETPDHIYKLLHDVYNFQVDACATKKNTKCAVFYKDALEKKWLNKRTFMNPPYGKGISKFTMAEYWKEYQQYF